MAAFFLGFVAIAFVMLGGREALRVARLAARMRGTAMLLGASACAVFAGFSLATWIATGIAPGLIAPWDDLLVAGALGVAALEVLLLRAPPAPAEPTRSLGAVMLVLLSSIVADASGLVVLALVAATGAPVLAAGGAMLGAIAVLGAAVLAGEDWERLPLAAMRMAVGAVLVVAALYIGLPPLIAAL